MRRALGLRVALPVVVAAEIIGIGAFIGLADRTGSAGGRRR